MTNYLKSGAAAVALILTIVPAAAQPWQPDGSWRFRHPEFSAPFVPPWTYEPPGVIVPPPVYVAPPLAYAPSVYAPSLPAPNDTIRWVQQALNALNNAGLEVDGVAGPMTNAAIASFQAQNGLVADGVATNATIAVITSKLNAAAALLPPAPPA